ncbi:MAG: hypothetical protein MI757_22200 [Pirellulales bacterium]|nr:hypothetical protein [Pirellulales bacterium]
MARPHTPTTAYTLIEILLVVSVLAVLAAVMITGTDSSAHDRLRSLAEVIQSDLTYARSLAVANATPYRVSFDADAGTYTLEHAGTDASWDNLPASPYHPHSNSAVAQTVTIADLPSVGGDIEILGAFTEADDNTLTRVDTVTFGAIGQTQDRADATVIWLAAGAASELRYMAVRINPVTGLVEIEDMTGTRPSISDAAPPVAL